MDSTRAADLGVAASREFSAVIAGVLGAARMAKFDGSWVPRGIYTFVLAVITLGTTFIATETQARDLTPVADALDERRASSAVGR